MGAMLQQDGCTQNDYVRLFADSAEPLRWLCYSLTGDEELSERVLKAALEQCLKGAERVFRDWMVSWARRLIIRARAEITHPWNSAIAQEGYPVLPMRWDAVSRQRLDAVLSLPLEILQQRLLRLDALSRFVLVLRAIEGYSRRETALLLNLDDRLCEWVYVRAVEALEAEHGGEFASQVFTDLNRPECLAQAGD